MPEIVRSGSCGNAPKNEFLEELAVALVTCDVPGVLGRVTDTIQWRIVGRELIQGKEALAAALQAWSSDDIARVAITYAVSHGRAGAVNGVIETGDAGMEEFCHVFDFATLKGTSVSRITSYVVRG